MVETKEISELTRSNRIAMLSHISTVTVMVFFMIWESVRGQLSPVYMTIATVVGVIPLIGEVICWKSNTEHAMIKHLVSYGFSLFYTICLFTSPTNLIYVFVIPMIFVVTIYSDTRYLLLINTGTILESIIVVVIGATKGGFGYHGIEAAVVQIVVMIMVGAYSVLTTKVIRENTRKRFTEVAQAKAEAENLLERNEELDQQLSGNIADINVRFEKLTAASKTTTEAMQEVSAGATDTAEHVQNQLEQTHAIQDKVDEVATAVEEIGNSMTLTLKALAEGKQDIEHLASEVEASVDNGTEVTGKGINKHYTVNLISTYDHICDIMKSNLIRKLDNHYWICKKQWWQIMHLKEQYNKTLMVDIGWISTQSRFFQDKTGFLIFTDSYIKVSKFKALNDFKYNLMTMVSGRRVKCTL